MLLIDGRKDVSLLDEYCTVIARYEDWEVLQEWLENEIVTQVAPKQWISVRLLIQIQQSLKAGRPATHVFRL